MWREAPRPTAQVAPEFHLGWAATGTNRAHLWKSSAAPAESSQAILPADKSIDEEHQTPDKTRWSTSGGWVGPRVGANQYILPRLERSLAG